MALFGDLLKYFYLCSRKPDDNEAVTGGAETLNCFVYGVLAQLVERLNGIQKVRSSILLCTQEQQKQAKTSI